LNKINFEYNKDVEGAKLNCFIFDCLFSFALIQCSNVPCYYLGKASIKKLLVADMSAKFGHRKKIINIFDMHIIRFRMRVI